MEPQVTNPRTYGRNDPTPSTQLNPATAPACELIAHERIVAIVRGLEPDQALHAASALADGGIRALEVTFTANDATAIAQNASLIEALTERLGHRLAIGAGTVTTQAQLDAAAAAGARFIVSPDTNPAIIARTRDLGLASLPGALTATECLEAYRAGADFVKVFPAGALGSAYITALRGPLPHIPFIAVGGISATNAREFLDAGAVGLGVGGRLVSRALAEAGLYTQMTTEARRLVQAVAPATAAA
jgi:2-dehydro-3-deoxyphosphogluconate aldolase/(4S)-4-hydroxy-2-oxoglutarate aldolase